VHFAETKRARGACQTVLASLHFHFSSVSVDMDSLVVSRSWCRFFMTGFPQTGLKSLERDEIFLKCLCENRDKFSACADHHVRKLIRVE
jgi:hypothetical protein